MSKSSLFVFARISPKDENFEEAKNAILNILQRTREEPGCRQFELHQDDEGRSLFLYEEWESESALEEHYLKPYTTQVFENYKQWLAAPVEIVKMRKCIAA